MITAVLAGILSGYKGRIVGNLHTNISAGLAYNDLMERFTYNEDIRLLYYWLAHTIVGVSSGFTDDLMVSPD